MTAAERLAALRGTADPAVTGALRAALAACATPAPSRPAPPVEVFAPVPERAAPFVCPDCGGIALDPLAAGSHVCPDCGARWTATADW